MAGAYLEIDPSETYTLSANVLLNNVAQELYGATVWFNAVSLDDNSNYAPFINLVSTGVNVVISNGTGISTNSVVTVTLGTEITRAIGQVNVGSWSLVAKTGAGRIYKLDGGRCTVLPAPSVSYT